MHHRTSQAKFELCHIQTEQNFRDGGHAQFQRHLLLGERFQGLVRLHLTQLSMKQFFDRIWQRELLLCFA